MTRLKHLITSIAHRYRALQITRAQLLIATSFIILITFAWATRWEYLPGYKGGYVKVNRYTGTVCQVSRTGQTYLCR